MKFLSVANAIIDMLLLGSKLISAIFEDSMKIILVNSQRGLHPKLWVSTGQYIE